MNKVLGICGGREVPASRFRVDAVFKELAARDWHTETIYGLGEIDQRLQSNKTKKLYRGAARIVRAARTAAVRWDGPVFVQRLALPWFALPEQVMSARSGQMVFDFDDAVFRNANGDHAPLRSRAFNSVCSSAAHVVAGNSWLAEQVPDNVQNLSIIPTCIDAARYTPTESPCRSGPVRIGWIGTSGNQKYLKHVIPALEQLRRDGFEFEFCMCSDIEPLAELQRLNPTFLRWSADTEVDTLRSFDIGIMPLDDSDWCRGKCSFKLIQYMAVSVPVVGSAVGFNNDVVEDGASGHLASNTQWYEPLASLLEDDRWRRDAGRRGREIVLEKFDISIAADRYETIFSNVANAS